MSKREIWFFELGYFLRRDIMKIKEKMDGETFFNFEVIEPNQYNTVNCNLGIRVDARHLEDYRVQTIKHTFLNCALSKLI